MNELDRFAAGALRKYDFHGLHTARVLSQAGDLSLTVRPDDDVWPEITAWLRVDWPGVEVRLAAGARVLFGFEGGSPERPFLLLRERAGILSIDLAGPGGGRAAARQGDQVTAPQLLPGTIQGQTTGITFTSTEPVKPQGQILTGSELLRVP